MKRRDFISLLGSAAATWPLAARAQQSAMPVIGFLFASSPDTNQDRLRGFYRGLKESGYIEGENVAIATRSAEAQYDRLPALAADLVRRQVSVIFAGGEHSALAAKAATTTIPIVFLVSNDPVIHGLVASIARPDGNVTGVNFVSSELTAKRLELLRELVPTAARVAVLVNPNSPVTATTLKDLEPAARVWDCKSRSFASAPSRKWRRPSQDLRASGPMRCSSVPTRSSRAGVCNWPTWRRAMRFR
jgi:putative tryptophan/tyrosine transport system substrate-binding protein